MNNALLGRIAKLQKASLRRIDYDLEEYFVEQERLYNSLKKKLSADKLSGFNAFITTHNSITHYQSKVFLYSLKSAVSEITKNRPAQPNKDIPPLLLATAFSGRLAGQTLYSPSDGYAIVIDESVFIQSGILSKVLIEVLTPIQGIEEMITPDPKKIHERIRIGKNCQSIFNDSLLSYISSGSATFAKYTPLPTDSSMLALLSLLADGMKQFVVSHELGHIQSSHFENKNHLNVTTENNLSGFDQQLNIPFYRQKQMLEHSADWVAFTACIEAEPHADKVGFKIFAIFAFLYFTETLSHSITLWALGKERFGKIFGDPIFSAYGTSINTHPPSGIRADILGELYSQSSFPYSNKKRIDYILASAKETVRCLWDNFMLGVDQQIIDQIPISKAHKKIISEINNLLYLSLPKVEGLARDDMYRILGVEVPRADEKSE